MSANAGLVLYAIIAVAGLVLLTSRFKLSAFIALILASVFLGLCAGLSPAQLMKAFQEGVGGVLGSIAMIIAIGTILGKVLAETGGARTISAQIVALFGPRQLPVAFFVIGLIVGLPVFFPVGLVLLVPILQTITLQNNLPLLRLGLPMVAGLSAAHGFVPPHPGPLAAIELLHADLGKTLLYSLPVAAVSGAIAGPLFTRFVPLRDLHARERAVPTAAAGTTLPSFAATLGAILIPLLLMAGTTLSNLYFAKESLAFRLFTLIGHPIIALLMGVLFAYAMLCRGMSRAQILKLSEDSLAPVASILLVIGAGAGFSRVLIEAKVGDVVATLATSWNLPALPMGFLLAALIRIATGSATVAITTSAGLLKRVVETQAGTNLELLVLAMGAGSLVVSHLNDGGFWLVKEYLNLSVPQALRTWTALETILGLAGFGCVLLLNALL